MTDQRVFSAKLLLPILLLASLLLSSCGFQLRGQLPLAKYPAIHLQGDRHSQLLTELSMQLRRNNVQLPEQISNDIPQIKLDRDSLQRRTLSLFPNGQVAEYELIYTVNYQLQLPNQEPVPYRLNCSAIIRTIPIGLWRKLGNWICCWLSCADKR